MNAKSRLKSHGFGGSFRATAPEAGGACSDASSKLMKHPIWSICWCFNTICLVTCLKKNNDFSRIWFMKQLWLWCLWHVDCFHRLSSLFWYSYHFISFHVISYHFISVLRRMSVKKLTHRITYLGYAAQVLFMVLPITFFGTSNMGRVCKGHFVPRIASHDRQSPTCVGCEDFHFFTLVEVKHPDILIPTC